MTLFISNEYDKICFNIELYALANGNDPKLIILVHYSRELLKLGRYNRILLNCQNKSRRAT
jgi:hypothetical protein